jgi:hypothetical protein
MYTLKNKHLLIYILQIIALNNECFNKFIYLQINILKIGAFKNLHFQKTCAYPDSKIFV